MILDTLPTGPLEVNCYIIGCEKTRKAAVIDPGGDAYCKWKCDEADRKFPAFNAEVLLYETGMKSIYHDGGF